VRVLLHCFSMPARLEECLAEGWWVSFAGNVTYPKAADLARAAGATHMTVACLGAPGHPKARGLYYSVGFRELSRDAPLIKTKTAG